MEKNSKKQGRFLLAPLLILMFAQIGTSADNSVLSVATNSLISVLNASMNDIQLANMVYSLCAGAFMIVGGMLGIIIGWNKNFRIGASLVLVGEVILAISQNIETFTWGGRLVVGLGASLMIPSVLGMVPGIYKTGKERAFAFGAIGAATGIASAAGPVLAGILIDNFGFRVAFGFLALYFAAIVVGSSIIPNIPKSSSKLRFDYLGTFVGACGLFLFLIGISKINVWGLVKPIEAPFTIFGFSPALPLIFLGLIILVCLVQIEKRIERKYNCALIPSSFIKTAQVREGLYASGVVFFYLGGVIMVINPYLQIVSNYNALQTGFAMGFMGIPMFLFSLLTPKYLSHIHPKYILRIGYLLLAIGVVPMSYSLLPAGVSKFMYLGLFLSGIGMGLVSSQCSNIVATATNTRDAEQSGGIQTTSRNIGQALGVAILGMVMLFSLSSGWDSAIKKESGLSNELKDRIRQERVAFKSDAAILEQFGQHTLLEKEKQTLVKTNAEIRIHSTKYALYTMGLISVLFILGTTGIENNLRKDDRK
ncbi:MFS transporter [Enterococcus gallinarum]|uniref:Major facilitator superfamily n=1 Tax=Enterococcus gallinarum TaxID=1353 RepID=A0A376H3H9_ENTGA|nr:MFS transporter [Enterococcus gallinarum]OJG50667.1 major facilitator transporter [Enterococcus gallinarum]STD72017.1 major facilitator superfamily [Enterococcus gallinarum]STD83355.1 major facilitator superfamily [Enterococcus gallinarum]